MKDVLLACALLVGVMVFVEWLVVITIELWEWWRGS